MNANETQLLTLVDEKEFTAAERRLARVIVSTARNGGTMFRGRLAECEVAVALGASHPPLGTSPWDLMLADGRTVEVKSSANAGRFNIGRDPRTVDLWVFVHFGEGEADTHFTVATTAQVDAARSGYREERKSPVYLPRRTVREWGYLSIDELPAAVSPLM